jgi:7-carboxy-7-deazaguanine synthase
MLINEIFSSIEGEGIRTGYLATFIRTYGCNLLCSYCDTLYAVKPETEEDRKNAFIEMSVNEIVDKCKELGNTRITFTGGEPLIQKDADELINRLTEEGFEVNIETNGAEELEHHIDNWDNQERIIITMDWKSPSSAMRERMITSNLELLNNRDVLKFVVGTENDLQDMLEVINSHELSCHIFVSPVFGEIEGSKIVEYLKEHDLQNVRVQIQLHKVFWNPNERGV